MERDKLIKVGFPHKAGFGGPGSFQSRFEQELLKMGHSVLYANDSELPDIVIIVGGTKNIKWLRACKKKAIPIIYRLDGINWLHNIHGARQRNLKGWYKSTIINLLYKYIHAFLADYIIYQSDFVYHWWQKIGWTKSKPFKIINNGIDLDNFSPPETIISPKVICLEGNLDYTPFAIEMINDLHKKLSDLGIIFEVFGGIRFEDERIKLNHNVNYRGILKREQLPEVYRNSIYISLDINAACPNTVVEALGCGAPVIGYDTGALKEIIGDQGGYTVYYGENPWKVQYPGSDELIEKVKLIYANYFEYSKNARKLAEEQYGISTMVDKYITCIRGLLDD